MGVRAEGEAMGRLGGDGENGGVAAGELAAELRVGCQGLARRGLRRGDVQCCTR